MWDFIYQRLIYKAYPITVLAIFWQHVYATSGNIKPAIVGTGEGGGCALCAGDTYIDIVSSSYLGNLYFSTAYPHLVSLTLFFVLRTLA